MPPELQLLVIVIAFIGFWAIVIRPARNAQRRTAELQRAVNAGDRVMISAGILGTIIAVEDETVALEIAPGTTITVARQAVVRRLEDESAGAMDEDDRTPPDGSADDPRDKTEE